MNGKKIGSVPNTVTIGGTASLAIPANPNRVGLIISAPSAGRVSFSDNSAMALDYGFTMYSGVQPLILYIRDCGDVVSKPLYAIADAGGRLIAYTELILPGFASMQTEY